MKKKLLVVLLSLVCAVCLVLGLSACGETSDSGTDSNTNGGNEHADGTTDDTESDSWSNGIYTLKTAYAEAQSLGYSGSLEDFITAISGADGKDGVGISAIEINSSGELVITLTDNSYKNLGKISAACEHSFGAWTVGAEATCTSMGYKSRVCADCGYTEYQFTEATGHAYSTDAVTSDNYTHTLYCTNCNQTITQTHTLDSKYVCEVCDHHYYSEGLEFTVCYDDDGNSSYGVSVGNCIETDIVIPSVYKGYPVTSISDYSFRYNTTIKNINMPDSITTIGDQAFRDCTSLESINFSNNLTHIGRSAFLNCCSLKDILLPDSLTTLDDRAFYGCSSIINITLPDNLTSIGSYAFNDTAFYNDINNWEDCVLYIGNYLIIADTGISGSYTIKNGTKLMAYSAFIGCSSLTNITIAESITSIGNGVFFNCSSLKIVTISDSVISIGDSAFCGCSSLENIIIGNNVTSIGNAAFENCPSLKSVTIGSGVTSIGEAAFSGCGMLESVTFKNTSGWYVSTSSTAASGTDVDVSDPNQNATYLTSTYNWYYWYRSQS